MTENETGQAARFDDARLIGVFEHFYDSNRPGSGGYGTHYIVLGYEFDWPSAALPRPDDQHSELTTPKHIFARAQAKAAVVDERLCLDDDLGRGAA